MSEFDNYTKEDIVDAIKKVAGDPSTKGYFAYINEILGKLNKVDDLTYSWKTRVDNGFVAYTADLGGFNGYAEKMWRLGKKTVDIDLEATKKMAELSLSYKVLPYFVVHIMGEDMCIVISVTDHKKVALKLYQDYVFNQNDNDDTDIYYKGKILSVSMKIEDEGNV